MSMSTTAEIGKGDVLKEDKSDVKLKLKLSLAVLMGLPASGKTTLATKIESECTHRKTAVIIISYDKFIPHDVQAKCALLSENNVAKLLRKNFIKCVEIIVVELKKSKNEGIFATNLENVLPFLSETDNLVSNNSFLSHIDEILKEIRNQLQQYENETKAEVNNVVLLIDDNNYYSSMRNELYQIAKTHQTGFSILYCKTSVRTCRKRNSERDEGQVPDKTIVEMSLKLEEPDPMGCVCDSFCIKINESATEAGDVEEQDNIPLMMEVLQNSLKSPVDWKPPPDRSEEINRERRICSENEIHKADLVLRKWVNKELTFLTMLKSTGGKSKREMSRDLIRRKDHVLENLRSGESKLAFGVEHDLEFAQEITKLVKDVCLE